MSIINKLLSFFHLDAELEHFDAIHNEILKGITFKGTNLWILMFAILVASVGLNMNSTAVIIGAMLISPLMGPINGMGYSIATYDMELFKTSAKNLIFAIGASLTASTLYFALSPVSTAQSELLARTSPTIYDVLIALFGGLAGIVAISSRQKGNVIPGVAIATALMPPLCTAGYGLGTFQFTFFFGAMYLFTINTIFIGIATVWVSQILKFPIRTIIEKKRRVRINNMITAVIIIVLLPSIFFGYRLVMEENFLQNAKNYTSNVGLQQGNYLLKHNIDPKKKEIILVYGGQLLSDESKEAISDKRMDFNLENAKIMIEQGLTFTDFDTKDSEKIQLMEQIGLLSSALEIRESELDSIRMQNEFGRKMLDEITAFFPQIYECGYSETFVYREAAQKPQRYSVVMLSSKYEIDEKEKIKIENWIRRRINIENLKIIYEISTPVGAR
jgi:uncharacterized hydrophobic protein (TIGR00271 family)